MRLPILNLLLNWQCQNQCLPDRQLLPLLKLLPLTEIFPWETPILGPMENSCAKSGEKGKIWARNKIIIGIRLIIFMIWLNNKTNQIQMVCVNFGLYQDKKNKTLPENLLFSTFCKKMNINLRIKLVISLRFL